VGLKAKIGLFTERKGFGFIQSESQNINVMDECTRRYLSWRKSKAEIAKNMTILIQGQRVGSIF